MDPLLQLLPDSLLRTGFHSTEIPRELEDVAKEIAARLCRLPMDEAAKLLTALNAQVAKEYGAAHAALQTEPIPPEILEEAVRSFNEAEILEAINEIHNGGGRGLEEFLPDLERIASQHPPQR